MRPQAVEALLRKGKTPLGGVPPRYRDLGLPNAIATALKALRVHAPSPPIPPAYLDSDLLRGARTVLVLAIDGLGYLQTLTAKRKLGGLALLDAAQEDGTFFPITATVPSTTVSAIGSLCTAVPPQDHGLVGYRLFLKEFGGVANMIRFSPVDRSGPPYDPTGFVPVPTVFEIAAARGVPPYVLTRERYIGSALSTMVHRGAQMVGYVAASDFGVRIRQLVAGRGRRLVFAYWDTLDSLCHRFGTEGEEFLAEVAALDAVLEREVLRRANGVTVLLTADHGHINTFEGDRLDLRTRPSLFDHMAVPPTGEPRLVYLHARDGQADALRDVAERELGESARVATAQEAFDAGLFGVGPPSDRARERVGDVLLAPKREGALIYGYPGERIDLIGRHGGLSPQEMLVPFLVARL